jgi:D-methionine transport system permease protein
MTVCATIFAYVLGLPWGVILAITDKEGICPNKAVYTVLDFVTNVLRSIPFLILLIWIQPVTRFIIGKSYGSSATMFPLFVAAAPFIARLVEGSLKEVDHGVVEAATSMGASTLQIIFKVLIVEARTSLIVGITIALGTILGYSAMAGTVGGGGLGDIAIRYGYYRREEEVMFVAVVLLVILIQVLQGIGMKIAKVVDKRISN